MRLPLFVPLLVLALAACGGDDGPIAPVNEGTPNYQAIASGSWISTETFEGEHIVLTIQAVTDTRNITGTFTFGGLKSGALRGNMSGRTLNLLINPEFDDFMTYNATVGADPDGLLGRLHGTWRYGENNDVELIIDQSVSFRRPS